MESSVEVIWRTATHQCELLFVGPLKCRLLVWANGALSIDEEVGELAAALRRAAELHRWAVTPHLT
jgi:hypothetical protein